ncbi:MAG: GtrA family protein [Candidatus Sedimenticola sp. (ex Thyasira tokunagai)]
MVNPGSLLQVGRFGVVGILATGVHGLALYMFVEWVSLLPVIANSCAFLVAVVVSYVGHYLWTFHANTAHASTFTKFFIMASSGFLLNALIMEVTVNIAGLHYFIGFTIIVLTVPVATFLAGRYWVFR